MTPDQAEVKGPWDGKALGTLREWDPGWAEQCLAMFATPWTSGILPRKTFELFALAWCSAPTNLNANGTRRHIRGGLDAGDSG